MATRRVNANNAGSFVGRAGDLLYNVDTGVMRYSDGSTPGGVSLGGAASDHGGLTGLADDDHSQYHNDTRGDARYALTAAGVPVGGTTGQVLAKNSNTNLDTEWIDAGVGGGLTTPQTMALAFIKL